MNYVISFIRNTLNAKYSGIQIKDCLLYTSDAADD